MLEQLKKQYQDGLADLAKLYLQEEGIGKQINSLKEKLTQLEIVFQYDAELNKAKEAEVVSE